MSSFQIFSPAQIEDLRIGGRILREALVIAGAKAKAGMTTLEVDKIAEDFIRSHKGARPAFKGYHGFPGTICASVNEQCVHGIPGDRVLKDGDILSIDCGVIYGELYTDACITVPIGTVPEKTLAFLRTTEDALAKACDLVRPGAKVGDISSVIQKTVEGGGYSCVDGLTGHGLGDTLHQFPDVPNVGKRGTGPTLPVHTIIAIEPITSMGKPEMKEIGDGWTIVTRDGSLSAHFEHTVLVTEQGVEIIA